MESKRLAMEALDTQGFVSWEEPGEIRKISPLKINHRCSTCISRVVLDLSFEIFEARIDSNAQNTLNIFHKKGQPGFLQVGLEI